MICTDRFPATTHGGPVITECNTTALPFQPRGWREIVAEFNGEMITSDAGVLLLRDANERLRPISRFAECFGAFRNPDQIDL